LKLSYLWYLGQHMWVVLRIIPIKRAPGRKVLIDIVGHNFTTEISLATESIMTQLFLGISDDFLILSHLCSFSTFIKSSLVLPLPSPHLLQNVPVTRNHQELFKNWVFRWRFLLPIKLPLEGHQELHFCSISVFLCISIYIPLFPSLFPSLCPSISNPLCLSPQGIKRFRKFKTD